MRVDHERIEGRICPWGIGVDFLVEVRKVVGGGGCCLGKDLELRGRGRIYSHPDWTVHGFNFQVLPFWALCAIVGAAAIVAGSELVDWW